MNYLKKWLTRLLIDRTTLRSMVRDEVELYLIRNPEATKEQVEQAMLKSINEALR